MTPKAQKVTTTEHEFEYLLNSKVISTLPSELKSYRWKYMKQHPDEAISFGDWLHQQHPECFERHFRWYKQHGDMKD